MRPIIAITSSEILRSGDEWAPKVHGQSATYPNAILKAGGTPFIISVFKNEAALKQLYDQCQGILLSGGGDIDPAMYGAKRSLKTKNISPLRDRQEKQLLEWALEDDKPVLGICRGMQLLNVALGGSLLQDIQGLMTGAQNHEISAHKQDFNHMAHNLKMEPNSKLAKILGVNIIKTNALHHQAISILGKNLKAVAYAEDGIIEAIELPNKKFVIGVQSHPEGLKPTAEPLWYKLFNAFVAAAT